MPEAYSDSDLTTEQHTLVRNLITAVFQAWTQGGISFQILRDYEPLPQNSGNDLNVLVGAAERPQAEAALLQAARQCGFELLIRAEFASLALFLGHVASGAQVHIDLTIGFRGRLETWTSRVRRWLRPPGIAVVLCGADGCGKSTAATLLVQEVAGTFPLDKGVHYHWKPPVFTGKRQAARAPTTDPHSAKPRPLSLSLAFFAFHWVEFFCGAFVRLQPVRFRGGMALIDRYYYDFLVDQRRYRLRVPLWLVRLGYCLLPKPDLVFALDAPTAVLRQRKQEVAESETARQRQAYADLISSLPNGRIIDATQSPDHVAAAMRREIFAYLMRRELKRSKRGN